MEEKDIDQKINEYAKKYPFDTCCFHNELGNILSLSYSSKKLISAYIDYAEEDPEIDHINSLKIGTFRDGLEINFTHTPK